MVSSLQSSSPNHCFHNRAPAVVPRALRLPRRAQKSTKLALSATAVSIRGHSRPSEISSITFSDKPKTFSQYRRSLLRTVLFLPAHQPPPLQLRELLQKSLQFLVILNGSANPLFPLFRNAQLARLAVMALYQIERDVKLPTTTAATFFAALAASHRKRSAKQLAGMSNLSNARTSPTF